MLGIGADRNLPTVLLIDDDMISREVIATILTLNGYTLHTADGGESAVAMLEKEECIPQVILVDVMMEGLNGVELIKALRGKSAAGVYAISGSVPPDEVKMAVDGFLMKPFGPEALQKLLDEHLPRTIGSDFGPHEPVISPKILSQFRQMMPAATVKDVYLAVLSDLQKRVAALEGVIARGEATEVRRIGHTIKGGCGMAGARQAARLGALLEAEGDDLSNSAALRLELKEATENLGRMLEVEFPT
jgi:CheY-like chemotaxis protein